MNIIGTIYLVDEPNIDVLKRNLMNIPPPGGRLATGTIMCMDMDETDNMLELWFPEHCQKATLLCPPPLAMYKEIDGDLEGFIQAYNEYLDYDESVQDFIASMLLYLHIGGDILLYTPSHIEDDAIWVNTLVMYFFTRFGITIGTSATNQAAYDPRYDSVVAVFIYSKGLMDVFDFVNSYLNPYPDPSIVERLCMDLSRFCGPGDNPMELYDSMITSLTCYGTPLLRPAVVFGD